MPKHGPKEKPKSRKKKANVTKAEGKGGTRDESVPRVAIDVLPISDKATKRVIAPFVRIIRKGQKLQEAEEAKLFSLYLQKKPSVLIRDLSSFLSDTVDLIALIHETANVLKLMTKACSVTVYMMDPSTSEIYQSDKDGQTDRHKIRWKIKDGPIVATYVAYHKQHVLVDDIITDGRFPEGVGYQSDTVKSVLCVPVVTPDGACFAVVELTRLLADPPFVKDDLKITLIVTGWMGAAIYENSRRLALQRQQELNDYLLDLTKCYFGESVVMDKMISEISSFAKETLQAERSAVFVIDPEGGDDMVAEVFDDNFLESKDPFRKPQRVRFSKERGISGLVARTGVTINLKDAYQDTRFNKEIDQKTGFITRSIMCMPIMGVDGILGVVQVINKRTGGYFTSTDEALFQTFSTYCALALRYTKVQKKLESTNNINNCYLKMIKLQSAPCVHDWNFYIRQKNTMPIPLEFENFTWYIRDEHRQFMPTLCLYMLNQLIKNEEFNNDRTLSYILTVRKFYRKNPFHNFEHAFNVTHCMYLLLKKNHYRFTPLEVKALMIAALCHNLDHGGCTNSFLEAIKDDLTYLYDNSIWQNHHYYVTTLLLEENKIFPSLSCEEHEKLLQEIKDAIISTDLQQYFINRIALERIVDNGVFNWANPEHKTLLKGIMMASAILCGVCKPFLVAKRITDNVYTELYRQGDLEKERGLCSLQNMEREKFQNIPEEEVKYMSIVAVPCYLLLKKILPNTECLHKEASFLMETWEDIIAVRGKKCWRQDDSIVAEQKFHY